MKETTDSSMAKYSVILSERMLNYSESINDCFRLFNYDERESKRKRSIKIVKDRERKTRKKRKERRQKKCMHW